MRFNARVLWFCYLTLSAWPVNCITYKLRKWLAIIPKLTHCDWGARYYYDYIHAFACCWYSSLFFHSTVWYCHRPLHYLTFSFFYFFCVQPFIHLINIQVRFTVHSIWHQLWAPSICLFSPFYTLFLFLFIHANQLYNFKWKTIRCTRAMNILETF